MGILDHLTCLLRNLYAGQEVTEPDMEQRTGSKLGKEYVKAVYCHPAYLSYVQSASWEAHPTCAGWITSWNQDGQKKYQQPQICRWYHPNGRNWRGTKELLKEGERGMWKNRLKTQPFKKLRSWYLIPSLHGKKVGKKWRQWTVTDFIFLAPKSLWLQSWN